MAEVPRDWRTLWPPPTYWAKVTFAVTVTLAVLFLARSVHGILLLVLVAAVLAIGLDPAVRRLERWKFRRGWAVVTIFIATLAFLVVFFSVVVPPLVREARELAGDIPGYVNQLKDAEGPLGDLARQQDLSTKLGDLTERLPSLASSSFSSIFGVTKGIATLIFNVLTVSVLTVYFLLALPRMRRTAVAIFDPEDRDRAERVLDESLEKIGGYVSGNIVISIIAGVLAFIALSLIGVPFAAALAMWVAIADLIPSVGAMLGAIVAIIVAAFSSLWQAAATAGYFLAYQQLIENYWLAPRVFKKAIDLSPAVVIVSVLIGGSLAGFAGALLALPIAAAFKVVFNDVWLARRLAARSPEPDDVAHPT